MYAAFLSLMVPFFFQPHPHCMYILWQYLLHCQVQFEASGEKKTWAGRNSVDEIYPFFIFFVYSAFITLATKCLKKYIKVIRRKANQLQCSTVRHTRTML